MCVRACVCMGLCGVRFGASHNGMGEDFVEEDGVVYYWQFVMKKQKKRTKGTNNDYNFHSIRTQTLKLSNFNFQINFKIYLDKSQIKAPQLHKPYRQPPKFHQIIVVFQSKNII
jgi:hypothetical protein